MSNTDDCGECKVCAQLPAGAITPLADDDGEPLSKKAKVLKVARTLPQPFTAELLVVECWKADWIEFGLSGHEHHADSNSVLSCCYGSQGLIRRGHLRRVGPKLFVVGDIK